VEQRRVNGRRPEDHDGDEPLQDLLDDTYYEFVAKR
jgi:hypothetical protein